MSCGCEQKLMGNLMGALLPAGSQVKTGFQIYVGPTLLGSQWGASDLQNAIEGCVYATGGFDAVTVDVQGSYVTSTAYVTVAVQTFNDHADIEDVGAWIQGAIQSCLPDVEITRRDATVGVGSVDAHGNPLPQGNLPASGGNPNQPAKCDWNKLSFGDYIACETGFSKTTGIVAVLALVLVGVVALKR